MIYFDSGEYMKKKSLFTLATIGAAIPTIALAQSPANAFIEQNSRTLAWMIVVYVLPSLISLWRKHPSKGSIIAVNILLGWTGIGWIWAFIWSLGSTRHNVVVVNPAPVIATPQNAPAALPVANKTIAERISELKAMLDSGTISPAEFELLKADAMKAIS